jgi:hypothetical protein
VVCAPGAADGARAKIRSVLARGSMEGSDRGWVITPLPASQKPKVESVRRPRRAAMNGTTTRWSEIAYSVHRGSFTGVAGHATPARRSVARTLPRRHRLPLRARIDLFGPEGSEGAFFECEQQVGEDQPERAGDDQGPHVVGDIVDHPTGEDLLCVRVLLGDDRETAGWDRPTGTFRLGTKATTRASMPATFKKKSSMPVPLITIRLSPTVTRAPTNTARTARSSTRSSPLASTGP